LEGGQVALSLDGSDTARRVVFVSHANPDDNDFARWLTLQLVQHGYDAWCDVANLIGGEDFWHDIETTIRNRTAKFLFVLSRASNTKQGTLNELSVAKITERKAQLKDFVIPLRIDDILHGDMNIELARLNAISFKPNWARGLSRLLEKLEEDTVPRNPDQSRTSVAAWWRRYFSPDEGVKGEEEKYASNWFEIVPKPERLLFHEISRSGPGPVIPPLEFSYPVVPHSTFLISFAEAELLRSELESPHEITRTVEVPFADFASDDEKVANIERRERRSIITNLLRQSWGLFVAKQDVVSYELANKHTCVFYTHLKERASKMPFKDLKGGVGFRTLTGYRTVAGPTPDNKKKRFWHFAISMRPMTYPILGFAVYYHVLFSDDGKTPWTSKDRLHAARRRQCWDWWNDDWRDRILAFLATLAGENESLTLPAGEKSLQLSLSPLLFTSPVSYEISGKSAVPARDEVLEAEQETEDAEDFEEEIEDDDDVL
jgi:TIR domain-containing protein